MFFYYIAAVYGASTLQGNFSAWSKNTFLIKGYVAGDTVGNLAFAAHALLAGIVGFGGALQLIPQIRARFMSFHRWNGRVFLLTAMATGLSGLYLVWVRDTTTTLSMVGSLGVSLNGVLMIVCSALAWRFALARDFSTHRRWALRTYLVSNGQWFTRVGMFAWIIVNQGPVGITKNMDGPFNYFWDFGCYLLPLAVLELYLRAKDNAGPRARFAMAGALVVLTVLTGVGIFGVYTFMWRPALGRL